MRVIYDARQYNPFTVSSPGASEAIVYRIAHTLASAGHDVHVIAEGIAESWGGGVSWWPAPDGPRSCDVLITGDLLVWLHEFEFSRCYSWLTSTEPITRGQEKSVTAFVCLSEAHRKLLRRQRPAIAEEQTIVIPPGVDVRERTVEREPHRMIWLSSPDRGLWHLSKVWPDIIAQVPDAKLAITYGLDAYIERYRWHHNVQGLQALELEYWVSSHQASVESLGRLSQEQLAVEQQRASLLALPYDPMGSDAVHSLAVMEMAAWGCPLLLSAHQGLPEVFRDAADFLSMPITWEEWAIEVPRILGSQNRQEEMSAKALAWAKKHPWKDFEGKWRELIRYAKRPGLHRNGKKAQSRDAHRATSGGLSNGYAHPAG